MHCTCSVRPPLWRPVDKGVVFETRISVRLVDQESLTGIFPQDPLRIRTGMIGLPDLEDADRYPMDIWDVWDDAEKKSRQGFICERPHAFWQASLKWKREDSPLPPFQSGTRSVIRPGPAPCSASGSTPPRSTRNSPPLTCSRRYRLWMCGYRCRRLSPDKLH